MKQKGTHYLTNYYYLHPKRKARGEQTEYTNEVVRREDSAAQTVNNKAVQIEVTNHQTQIESNRP